ncbi:hypothetical protein BT93_J1513 [Corymbia citriodora subsp. variegata]|nr:hypothetical protein BT93_J1513 [Corymbia citriodora subsp. variegata]
MQTTAAASVQLNKLCIPSELEGRENTHKLLHPCVIEAKLRRETSNSGQQRRARCTRSPSQEKDMQGTADSEVDQKLFDRRRRAQNPLVPIGAFVTAGVLAAGLMSFQ